ncbi:MAG: two-component sensor histidine kinase [Desulfatitalea sp.]|nr:two-component sensor histidine kinase [Desulfatitalea sp.]NNK01054.1 two-component sensor histidine kinase [Desulfatitalea sp.]
MTHTDPKDHREELNFRLIWLLSFLLTASFAIVPVIFFAVIDYNVTKHSVVADAVAQTSRLTSNNWRSVAFFFNERQNALKYIVHDNRFSALNDIERLTAILASLRSSFGGFTDLGVVDANGIQRTYVGPYQLSGNDYSGQSWFVNVVEKGHFISEVFYGFRGVPHMVIAIKQALPNGGYYILRSAIEHQLSPILSEDKTTENSDAFIINRSGTLQTPSSTFGDVLHKIPLDVPAFSKETEVIESLKYQGTDLIVGYRYIPDTPYILMVVNEKRNAMETWHQSQMALIRYLSISITIILLGILGITTYLVRRLRQVDKRRVKYLHMAEYSNKLASIGRLAAGVAHEINNPLAIINEKAGLVKDMFTFKQDYKEDPRLMETMDSILNSVVRCSRITRQLLSFARHMHVSLQVINLKKLVHEVLGFLSKEAEFRSINVVIDIGDDIPDFTSDRGKLQQIFLNIINNAFSAMTTGGTVTVHANKLPNDTVRIDISDTGCGLAPENLKHMFEPFFSTKTAAGGTGLGLSITYSLVHELDGRIDVKSELGKGTTFTIHLPLEPGKKEEVHACTPSG